MTASRWRTPAAGVLSGLLFALAFPPHDVTVLLPLALVPWIAALAGEERRARALVSGLLFGMAFWCASVPWISYVVTVYGGQPRTMGAVCVALLALICAEWTAVLGWGIAALAPPGSWKRLAAFPVLWMAAEHARSVIYGGFPWNLTGWALARRTVWIQTASIWGVYGVGFAVAAVATLLAGFALRRKVGYVVGAAAVVLGIGIAGAMRLTSPVPAGAPVRVRLIQPNLSEEDRRSPENAAAGYRTVIARGEEAALAGADLLVFPESAFPMYWDKSPRLRDDLGRLAETCRCAILFNDVTFEKDGRASNAARVLTPGGLAQGIYRKVHLVPFGEYVPLPRLFFFARQISQEIGEFLPAETPVVLRSGPLALGVGVCYEIIYPGLARRQTADGANLLVTISNDSWYGRAGAQEQHFAGALFRAVENGRYLVRAAITGVSGIVDPRGRISSEIPPDRTGTAAGTVFLLDGSTPWTRWGYVLPRVADAAAAGMLLFGLARWGRERAARRRRPAALPGDTT
ncbi:MAG: apolipoprotein N-acyltransferase [Acidobacteriota bacterium]